MALCRAVEEKAKWRAPAEVWAAAVKHGHLDRTFGIKAARRRGRPPGPSYRRYQKPGLTQARLLSFVEQFRDAVREEGYTFRSDAEFWKTTTEVWNEVERKFAAGLGGERRYDPPETEAFRRAYFRAKAKRRKEKREGYDSRAFLHEMWLPPLPPRARAIKGWLLDFPFDRLGAEHAVCVPLLRGLLLYVEQEENRSLRSHRGSSARHLREAAHRKDLRPAERAWNRMVLTLFVPLSAARERALREDFRARYCRKQKEGETVGPIEVLKESGAALGLRLR